MSTHCIRLVGGEQAKGVHAVGALQFVKGYSQPMSEADARGHLATLHTIDANAGKLDEESNPLPFAQAWKGEVVPRPVQEAPTPVAVPAAPIKGKG
jgi:hypothetical protein